ncbi:MAG: hypothetical protein HQM00_08260 [Magnetococcales bacterium]|nr:hypothetical protein [Magnetococcales bacterium]
MNKKMLIIALISVFCVSGDVYACDRTPGSDTFTLYHATAGVSINDCWECPAGNPHAFSCRSGANISQKTASLWVKEMPKTYVQPVPKGAK